MEIGIVFAIVEPKRGAFDAVIVAGAFLNMIALYLEFDFVIIVKCSIIGNFSGNFIGFFHKTYFAIRGMFFIFSHFNAGEGDHIGFVG